MINAIAIDDEPLALEVVKSHAEKIPFLALKETFNNPIEALSYLDTYDIDLLFLDISLPSLSGIEFLKTINRGKIFIIFTTAHSKYALESYELEVIDYLLKPFDFPRFLKSINKVKERIFQAKYTDQGFFFVNTGYQQKKISIEDINYVKGDGNYVTYCMKKENVMVRSSIKETINILPYNLFKQVHRSYIISLKQIDKIEDNHIFISDQRISIGASYKENFMKALRL